MSFSHILKRHFILISGILLSIYLVNGMIAIPQLSVTYDEADHLNYAVRLVKGHPEKVKPFDDASTMPISALNTIPRIIEQVYNKDIHKTDGGVNDIINGRFITLFICLLIGVFICKWSKDLFGNEAGVFSLFLFVFCTNLNANAWLVTTDAYTALFVLMTAYYFYRFVVYSGWNNFIAFCISIGISQVVKQSLILLFFFFAVASLIILIRRDSFFLRFRINLLRFLIFGSIVLLCINTAFLFNGTGMSLAEYNLHSDILQTVQRWHLIRDIPLPLPAPFVEGFDLVKYMLGLGSGHTETSPRSYLFGHYFTGKGPWYYYPVIIGVKTSLIVLLLLVILIIGSIKSYLKDFWAWGFPLVLAGFFLLSVVFLNTSQHGIRHLILIYPLIYVSLGKIVQWNVVKYKSIVIMVLLYSVVTFYFYYPNLLSYTNELLWNKTKVYRTIASSNIDYGQCNHSLIRYMNKNQDVQWPEENPKPGKFILGINAYLDLQGTGKYSWLRNFSPIKHIDHCYLLFIISEQDLKEKLNEH